MKKLQNFMDSKPTVNLGSLKRNPEALHRREEIIFLDSIEVARGHIPGDNVKPANADIVNEKLSNLNNQSASPLADM